jgi:hypothetical protein
VNVPRGEPPPEDELPGDEVEPPPVVPPPPVTGVDGVGGGLRGVGVGTDGLAGVGVEVGVGVDGVVFEIVMMMGFDVLVLPATSVATAVRV